MKKMVIMTIIYFTGLFIFLLTGICKLNILFYTALAIGVLGCVGIMITFKDKKTSMN